MYLVSLSIIVACVTFFDKDSRHYNLKDRNKVFINVPRNTNINIRQQKIKIEKRTKKKKTEFLPCEFNDSSNIYRIGFFLRYYQTSCVSAERESIPLQLPFRSKH